MTVSFNNPKTPNKQVSTPKQTSQASFGRKAPVVVPEKISNGIENFGVSFDSAMQRGLTGVFAFATQPIIDSKNKEVDKKTRQVAAARTKAKIIAGTTTGFTIREICVQLTKLFSKNDNIRKYEYDHSLFKHKKPFEPKEYKKFEQFLLSIANKGKPNEMTAKQIKQMRNAVGTVAAIGIMIFTNVLIDTPLTTYIQNKIIKKQENEGGKKCQ